MTRDDIIRMAQECHLIGMRPHLDGLYQEAIEQFAALAAAHEREACAKVCDEWATQISIIAACAKEIRARSQQ